MIPIISFILLQGKCRYCHKKLNPNYLFFEIFFGLIALALGYYFDSILLTSLNLIIVTGLLIVAGIDWQLQEIVEPLVAILAVVAVILAIITHASLKDLAHGLLSGGGLFLIMVLVSRGRWMGIGDIEVGGLLGLWLGFPVVLVALMIAFITGAGYGIYLLQIKKAKMGTKVPFGPFLVLGGIIALFFGKSVLHWYLGGIL